MSNMPNLSLTRNSSVKDEPIFGQDGASSSAIPRPHIAKMARVEDVDDEQVEPVGELEPTEPFP